MGPVCSANVRHTATKLIAVVLAAKPFAAGQPPMRRLDRWPTVIGRGWEAIPAFAATAAIAHMGQGLWDRKIPEGKGTRRRKCASKCSKSSPLERKASKSSSSDVSKNEWLVKVSRFVRCFIAADWPAGCWLQLIGDEWDCGGRLGRLGCFCCPAEAAVLVTVEIAVVLPQCSFNSQIESIETKEQWKESSHLPFKKVSDSIGYAAAAAAVNHDGRASAG